MEEWHRLKKKYLSPAVEIFEYSLENGFAESVTLSGQQTGGIRTTRLTQETWNSGEWIQTEETDAFMN